MPSDDIELLRECRLFVAQKVGSTDAHLPTNRLLARIDARLAQPEAADCLNYSGGGRVSVPVGRILRSRKVQMQVEAARTLARELPKGEYMLSAAPEQPEADDAPVGPMQCIGKPGEKIYTREDAEHLCTIAIAAHQRGHELSKPLAPVAAQPPVFHCKRHGDYYPVDPSGLCPGCQGGDSKYDKPVAAQSGALALADFLNRMEVHSAPDWACGFAFTVRDIPGRFENAEAAHNAYITDARLRKESAR